MVLSMQLVCRVPLRRYDKKSCKKMYKLAKMFDTKLKVHYNISVSFEEIQNHTNFFIITRDK